jgi:hypothetical protein
MCRNGRNSEGKKSQDGAFLIFVKGLRHCCFAFSWVWRRIADAALSLFCLPATGRARSLRLKSKMS